MGKLKKADFDNKYRFRESRSKQGGARCELCVHNHNQDGYCRHPERARRIILSEEPPWFGGLRTDLSSDRVCDLVKIPMPESITVPEIEEGFIIDVGSGILLGHCRFSLLHGDPMCPYIAAHIIDHTLDTYEHYEKSTCHIEIKQPHWEILCELPQCQKRIGRPPYKEDDYLRRQGFNSGYIPPPPPPPPTIGDGDIETDDFRLGEFPLVTKLSGPYVRIDWTEEAICHGVRLIKRLLFHPWIKGQPKTDDQPKIEGVYWPRVRLILESLGWTPVADRINFEIEIKMYHHTCCLGCGLRHYEEHSNLQYEFEEHEVVRRGGDPHCPNCGRQLTHEMNLSPLLSE
ncbi:MAG: hypothetical protein CEN88_31 [Candidatus Berkelbacteria bacterium Licking1014_2]|uniref:Uncharacterized protein n=1 Tax=Candidatus Berkelbacteria bacterium Licking1014_2 TaxID=2017146 RepID=A0A554LXX6_9BACT|nr:MAG: hypothetical protein CEN88_31 [Candidatus Berkelbacteria bacterium Licking1014_2]